MAVGVYQPTIRRIFFCGEKERGEGPPDRRLAFREVGCVRGLRSVDQERDIYAIYIYIHISVIYLLQQSPLIFVNFDI